MFTKVEDIKKFVLAGNATVTLVSMKTGVRYTYKVTRAKDKQTGEDRDFYFVGLLNGPDNENSYAYIGMINGFGQFVPANPMRTKVKPDAPSMKGFKFFWGYISEDMIPPQMEVWHEGKCGRCGRKLTVPESLINGLGPECFSKMGA